MVRTSVYNRREKRQGRVRRTLLSGSPWAISKACCVGTVLAAATLHSIAAKAADREISDDLTDPVRTSDGDGTGPGDITITDAGSVSVGSGAAVIIDSDNTVTSSGLISSDALVDAIGIFALTGTGVTSGIENQGTITIVPDAQDDDATGPNFGIRLEGTGLFTGTIVNGEDGVITVGGDGSVGIDAQAGVAGSITNDGEITVTGENAVGIRVTGGVTGNVESNGSISAAASGGTGVEVSGDVGGRVVNRGAITTGTASFRDEDDADIIRQDSGGPGILIGADVAGGILNEGDGEFPDEDGNTPDENDTADAVITARGSANAILVSSTAGSGAPRDLTVGALGTGEEAFAIVNRGQLASSAEIEGLDTVTVRIEGGTVGSDVFTATLDGGIHNAGGEITSASVDADATAISIGDHATVPEIRNSGLISAASRVTASDEDGDGENDTFGPGGDATGIVIDAQGQVDTITNAGRIVVTAGGQTASAVGIVDRSGTVAVFDNTGQITTAIQDDGLGRTIAVDLSQAATGIQFTNRGTIEGDVLLGAGADTVAFVDGTLTGRLDLGGGGGQLTLGSGSEFTGALVGGDGVALVVSQSSFIIAGTEDAAVRTASFDAGSTLGVQVSGIESAAGGLNASQTIDLAEGTAVAISFASFPADEESFVIASAETLTLAGGLDGLDLTGGSILFDRALSFQDGARQELVLQLTRKSAEAIGLNANQGVVYDASIEVLNLDSELGGIVANLGTLAQVQDIYDQLTPEASGATRLAALVAQNLAIGAISRRVDSLRDVNSFAARAAGGQAPQAAVFDPGGRVSVWGQQLIYAADRERTAEHVGVDGFTYGLALGIDAPLFGLDALGLGFTQTFSDYDNDTGSDGDLFISSSQLSLYASISGAGFFFDAMGNAAYNTYDNERTVLIEDVIRRETEGDWSAWQYGGSAQAGYRLALGWFGATLSGNVSYLRLEEDAYEETGGGEGVNLAVDERTTTSLRAGGGMALDARIRSGGILVIPTLRGGILREFEDGAQAFDVRFAAGTQTFSVTTPPPETTTYHGGGGIAFVTGGATFSFDYDAEFADDYFAHAASVSFRVQF